MIIATNPRARTKRRQAVTAASFARGRDHAIAMLDEAVAIGDERDGWRCFRRGRAQDNLVDGYLSDVLEDPSLRPGFTAVLSAAVQNQIDVSVLATLTLAEVQAGAVGADGTRPLEATSEQPVEAPGIDQVQHAEVDEVGDVLETAAALLDDLLGSLNDSASYGAQSLLIVAQEALAGAAAGRTMALQHTANGAIGEAAAVLRCVAGHLKSTALRGICMLVELAKEKHDLAITIEAISACEAVS